MQTWNWSIIAGNEIFTQGSKRQIYIDEQLKNEGESKGDDLGNAITESILAIAKVKEYE